MRQRPKHWSTDEIADLLAKHAIRGYVEIVLGSNDTAPNYASTSTRVHGAGEVCYRRNGAGGITTIPSKGAVVL